MQVVVVQRHLTLVPPLVDVQVQEVATQTVVGNQGSRSLIVGLTDLVAIACPVCSCVLHVAILLVSLGTVVGLGALGTIIQIFILLLNWLLE